MGTDSTTVTQYLRTLEKTEKTHYTLSKENLMYSASKPSQSNSE